MNHKVSVIMPTYNAARYLREAVDSLIEQTLTDFELLVIDDGSKDETLEILKGYCDERIKIIDGPRRGIAAALNAGLDVACGEYIARMDADDISLPTRFETQADFLDTHPEAGLCGTLAMVFTPDGDTRIFGNKQLEKIGIIDMLYDTVVCHPTVMFRRELFSRYKLRYNESFRVAEDQELWSRALRYIQFYGIQEVLYRYRLHPQSASQKKAAEGDLAVQKIRRELLNWLLPTGNYADDMQPQINALFMALGYASEKNDLCNGGTPPGQNGENSVYQYNIADKQKIRLAETILEGKRWKRAIVWVLFDRKKLRGKLKLKLQKYPRLYTAIMRIRSRFN